MEEDHEVIHGALVIPFTLRKEKRVERPQPQPVYLPAPRYVPPSPRSKTKDFCKSLIKFLQVLHLLNVAMIFGDLVAWNFVLSGILFCIFVGGYKKKPFYLAVFLVGFFAGVAELYLTCDVTNNLPTTNCNTDYWNPAKDIKAYLFFGLGFPILGLMYCFGGN